MIDEVLVQREAAALMPTYRRQQVGFVRGEGASLWDAEGRRYVDCMAGISMNNVGHCHPAVVAAVREQAGRLINTSNLYYTEPMIALAEWIRDNSLGGRVFFCNSGAEASEAALKLARKRGGPARPEVVALADGFHGRTYGALSLTGQPSKQEPFAPLVPGVRHVDRDDPAGLAAAVGDRTCAIVLEIVQGEVGVFPVADEVVRLARELADRHGALLIVDEIQTGLSRTGPLFAYQEAGIVPDVMCLAKSLGGGLPIGAIVARPEHDAVLQPGDHGSTFAGSPLACAAGLAACGVLGDPVLQASVRDKGARLLDGLRGLVADGLATEARGRGLMCAIDLPRPRAAAATEALLGEGFLVNNTSPRTIRMLPPLVIDQGDLDDLVAVLRRVLAGV
ncbi:aspartate aminotransferase family protein [Miltoncostaea marina]|uniref:aspartate aminotransferase family protein n=1 Tax=Miltoncostaea marina TaxID=2843215 RepID=UPI001C3CA87F|nr:acetylornithine/succinylornithine family transaminase [Miltoncostaea marina]